LGWGLCGLCGASGWAPQPATKYLKIKRPSLISEYIPHLPLPASSNYKMGLQIFDEGQKIKVKKGFLSLFLFLLLLLISIGKGN